MRQARPSKIYILAARFPRPSAQDQPAYGKGDQEPSHVDKHERPRVRFESRENGDGGVLDEKKCKPAKERNLRPGDRSERVGLQDQPGQGVIQDDRSQDAEEVGFDIVRVFNVGHGSGMVVQPHVSENFIPGKSDELVNDDQNPDRGVIDSSAHGAIILKGLPFKQDEIRICAT